MIVQCKFRGTTLVNNKYGFYGFRVFFCAYQSTICAYTHSYPQLQFSTHASLPYMPIQCIIFTVMALCLPTYSLQLLFLPSVLPSLLYTATLLCLPSPHYKSFQLCCLVCTAYLTYLCYSQSALLNTYSCIPYLVCIHTQSVMPKQISELPIALHGDLISFSHIRMILPNGIYGTKSQNQAM